MFDQCFANVWPKARQSPQTVSNGAVCFAKCKHDTLNILILSDLLAFQRGGILSLGAVIIKVEPIQFATKARP